MGTKLFGVVAAQNVDSANEIIDLQGLQDNLKFLRDEHSELSAFRIIGSVTKSKKIFTEKDCEDEKQKRCWNHVKVPFLYAEGELFDGDKDSPHPNADAAAAILKYCNANDVSLKPGFSVDGAILERKDESGNITENRHTGKHLSKTQASSAAFTVMPCNPKCAGGIFLENDLQKSNFQPSGEKYFEALQKSNSPLQSFSGYSDELALLYNLSKLHKSLESLQNAHTSVKCQQCGKGAMFYKAGSIPNVCQKCGSNYTIKQIWDSLNK